MRSITSKRIMGEPGEVMKLVRKVSRKRHWGIVYESERIFVPIPADQREKARSWVGRDLEIHVQPLSYGLAILVTDGERRHIDGVAPRLKFQRLMKDMESNS